MASANLHCSYTCPQLPPHPTPTNVRQLRPNDFSLVMAIGTALHHHIATSLANIASSALRSLFLPFSTTYRFLFLCADV